jgi:hypothetical protein
MQRWQDELTKHPLNTTVKQILDALEQDLQLEDPVAEIERARLAKVFYHLRETLHGLDPDVTPFDLLNQVFSHLHNNNILQIALSPAKGREAEVFRDLNERLAPILSYIAQLRASVMRSDLSAADLKSATEAFERFSREVDKRRLKFELRASDSEKKVVDAAAAIENLSQQAQSVGETFQNQMVNWAAEATATFSVQKAEFVNAQATNKAEFSETILSIKQSASDELKAIFAEQIKIARIKHESLDKALQSIKDDAEEKHKKILSLYQLVALDSVTGGHKKIADREFDAAQNWRWVTVISIGVTVVWLFVSLFWLKPMACPDRVVRFQS